MNIINALLLGAIQGLTEFLPVSSSGHLVIAQSIMDFNQPGVLFDTTLHFATSLAVIIYFRDKVLNLTKSDVKIILVGMIPAGIIGIFFQSFIEDLFSDTTVVGLALLLTAAMNYFTDLAQARRSKINLVDSVMIGLAQAFAIIPGISRSGATIFAGTSLGVERKRAAEYSFLLSVPTIAGASVVQLYSHGYNGAIPFLQYAAGFVSALIIGIISIGLIMRLLTEKKFKYFSLYTAVIGLLTILLL